MIAGYSGIDGSNFAGGRYVLGPETQRVDTLLRLPTIPVGQETDCAGLPGLRGSFHSLPVANATGMHCASPSGFIAAVK